MDGLYAVWDSIDGDFTTGTREQMDEEYEKRKSNIEEYISDGSNGDEEAYLMKVVRRAAVVEDTENENDPKAHGFDYWVKLEDIYCEEDDQ